MEQMLLEHRRSTTVLQEVLEAIRNQPHGVIREVERVESGNYHELPPVLEVSERKAASPKLQLAVKWLLEHAEDNNLSDRKLAEKLGISHPWIGKARKLIDTGNYQEVMS